MKKAAAQTKYSPTALHDLRRDWDAWNIWEQRAVTTLGVSSSLFAIFWLAMSFKVLG